MKIQQLLTLGYDILKSENIETYMIDTQLILSKVLNKDKLFIITNRNLDVEDCKSKEFLKLMEFRKQKMPVKYILQSTEFMGIDYFVKPGVLIPRNDTEILVEDAIDEIKTRNLKSLCDVCCGSGAIGTSIAHYIEDLQVNCYDISDIALEVTKINIERLNLEKTVRVFKSDLLSKPIEDKCSFDIIVSNPPYIKKDVIETLMEDVKNYEPFIALCGGEDGMDFYRRIIKESRKVLNPGGLIIFEIGYDQREEVTKLLEDSGFEDVICIKDLSGNDRVVKGSLFKS